MKLKEQNQKRELTNDELDYIDRCVLRMSGKQDEEYFRELLTEMVRNNAIPASILDSIPFHPTAVSKTKFDQIYDAALHLAFPEYSLSTLKKLLGNDIDENKYNFICHI